MKDSEVFTKGPMSPHAIPCVQYRSLFFDRELVLLQNAFLLFGMDLLAISSDVVRWTHLNSGLR